MPVSDLAVYPTGFIYGFKYRICSENQRGDVLLVNYPNSSLAPHLEHVSEDWIAADAGLIRGGYIVVLPLKSYVKYIYRSNVCSMRLN